MSKYFDEKSFLEPNVEQYGNHMIMSNVMKETKKKIMNIDTKYCDEYVNNRTNTANPSYNLASYTFTLPERMTEIKSMKVHDIQIPLTYYNISAALGNNYFKLTITNSDKLNNFIDVSYNSNPTAYTTGLYSYIKPYKTTGSRFVMCFIPDGYYDEPSLINTINNTIFTSVGAIFGTNGGSGADPAMVFNSYHPAYPPSSALVSSSYQTNNSTNYNYSMISARTGYGSSVVFTIDFAVSSTGDFDKYNFKSKLGWIMGFRSTSYSITSPSLTYKYITSENMMNLNTVKYLYLAIDEFSKGNQNSFVSPLSRSLINKNIIAKICIDSKSLYPYGSVFPANIQFGNLLSDKRTYSGGKIDIQKFWVQLLNEDGISVNLNGMDFSFAIEMEYE